jgi:hypothetical protein
MPELLKYSKQAYVSILQTAVWLLAIISPFIIPPPAVLSDQAQLWEHLTQFFVAVFIGLMLFPMIKFGKRQYATMWWKVSIVVFICGLIISASYLVTYRKSTVLIESGNDTYVRVVIGKTLTPAASREKASILINEHREATNEDLIKSFPPNDPSELIQIWERESIENNIRILSVLHLSTVLILSLLVLSIAQFLKCLNIKANEE